MLKISFQAAQKDLSYWPRDLLDWWNFYLIKILAQSLKILKHVQENFQSQESGN